MAATETTHSETFDAKGMTRERCARAAIPTARTNRRTERVLLLAVLISAQFVIMLDTSIVNVALPSIQQDLNLTAPGVAWVANAYFLAFGGFLLVSGRTADVVGKRRMFVIGAALFTTASVFAGLAVSETTLIAARTLQGLGAAALSPAGMAILLTMFTGESKAKAVSAWGAASAVGGATGVAAGGVVTHLLGWQWVFLLPVPATLIALLSARSLLAAVPETRSSRRLDIVGATTITGTALATIYAVLAATDHGPASPQTLYSAGAAVCLFAIFLAAERRAADPVLPPEMFRSRALRAGTLVGLTGGAARVCTFFLVALYLQQALAYTPREAGMAMVPTSLAVFTISVLVLPRLLKLFGPEWTLTLGMVLLTAGLLWLAWRPEGPTYLVGVLPGLLLAASGVALSFMPSTLVITSATPPTHTGLASGMASATYQIGGAVGIAVFSAVLTISAREAATAGVNALHASGYAFYAAFTIAAVTALASAVIAAVWLLYPKMKCTGHRR